MPTYIMLSTLSPEGVQTVKNNPQRIKEVNREVEQLGEIVDLQVARLIGRVSERGVTVELTDDARVLLGDMGYDPTYGARPLKRVIQKHLVDRLALGLLQGEFGPGDTVVVGAADRELTFTQAPAATPAAV